MKNMRLITLISLGVFMVVAACIMKKENTATQVPLYDTQWALKKIYTDSGITNVSTKAFIKFNKEKNSAGGNGSCNTFGSNATVEGQFVSFKNIFSTKMYCEDVQKTEDVFLKSLSQATRYEIKDKSLTLYAGETKLLEFDSK